MPPELKLGLTTAGILALFVALTVWLIRDWIREREKRKRREAYNLWFNREFIAGLSTRSEGLERCWRKLNLLRFVVLIEMQSEEYWHDWWQERWAKHHGSLTANGQTERIKLDGYYYYEEDK